jgi:hypothetical protein
MNVETAFLNGKLKEEVYLQLPEGYENEEKKIVKLEKAIYGLKQGARCWNEEIDKTLKENNYNPTKSDPCIYIKRNEKKEIKSIIGLYVDDCLLMAKKEEIMKMKEIFKKNYKMKDLGELKLILGIEIERNEEEIKLFQRNYTCALLERFEMTNCKPVDTPIEVREEKYNSKINEKMKLPFEDINLFQQGVGCLNYLSTTTRPDISFATSQIAKHVSKPLNSHWMQFKRILRYLKGTINLALVYSKINHNNDFNSNNNIIGYSDASYAPFKDDRKSIGAYIFIFNNGPISWSSKKQSIVALSSCEAEYRALSECSKESQWLKNLHSELNNSLNPIILFEDNQAAMKIAENNMFSKRTKHIDIRYHFIRELIQNNQVILKYCPTEDMLADALTKGLLKTKFNKLRSEMGLKNYS